MSKLYNPTGSTELMCEDCSNYQSDVAGHIVQESENKEVHELTCENCGNEGLYIHDTSLGGEDYLEGSFEEF